MVESKEDEGAETNGATTEPKEDSGSETKNANGHLPYGTERALFLRLWGWLAIVGSIVVVITTAAWYLISLAIIPQASMRAEEAAQEQLGTLTTQINGLEKRLSELTAKGQGAFEDIRELQGRADEAARNAADRAEDAQEQLTRLRDRISRANDVLAAIRDVESIAKDVAASPGLKDAVVNEITSELSGMITAFEDECRGDGHSKDGQLAASSLARVMTRIPTLIRGIARATDRKFRFLGIPSSKRVARRSIC